MARFKVELHQVLHLPILVIGVEDIQVKFRKRRGEAGPYLIVSRVCGLAFNTAFETGPGVSDHVIEQGCCSRN
jgi:hypothetical protein